MSEEDGQIFWVDKSTGTFADYILAFGWAEMLNLVTGGDVLIHDAGPRLKLRSSRPLDENMLNNVGGLADILAFIETETKNKKVTPPPEVRFFINYNREREKETAFFIAKRQQSEQKKRGAPDDLPSLPPAPHSDLPLFKLVNQMSALSAYNEVVQRWQVDQIYWGDYVRLLARFFSTYPNNLAIVEEEWKQLAKSRGIAGSVRATATQVMNPAMGKGGDAPKANSLTPGNKDSFWLVEFLKFVGAKSSAIPLVVQGVKDRKTYVPVPIHMKLSTHKRVIAELRGRIWGQSAIKMDVLAGLSYTGVFLEQWRDGNLTEYDLEGKGPSDFVSGLAVAFYKDMGSALALLNLTQLNIPDWMKIAQASDASDYLEMLKEHNKIVYHLEEKHSEEFHLLQNYRDFLSGHDLEAFYDFTAGYAKTLMSRLERGQPHGQPAIQFTISNLEVLIMGHKDTTQLDLAAIVETPGFRNLATAIRLSTIVPQQQKGRKQQPFYDIRYGLGDELRRKSSYPEELVEALGEFAQSYNQETVQKFERTGQMRRKLIKTEDLDQVVSLLQLPNASRTVGSLLIAYGYAREEVKGAASSNQDNKATGAALSYQAKPVATGETPEVEPASGAEPDYEDVDDDMGLDEDSTEDSNKGE